MDDFSGYKSFFRATLDAVMKSYEDPAERAILEARMELKRKRKEVNANETDESMPALRSEPRPV